MSAHRLNFWPSVVAVAFAFMVLADHCSSPTSLKAQDSLGDGRFLRRIEQEKSVYQQKIEAEVNAHLRTARDRMGEDSEGALRNLKTLQQIVQKAPGLENEVRTQLLRRIEAAMREANRRSVDESFRRIQAQQSRAAANERLRQLDKKARDEIMISQLMQRFNALKAEGNYREAEQVAAQIRQLDEAP